MIFINIIMLRWRRPY